MLNYLHASYAYVIPPILGFLVLFPLSLISLLKGRSSPANRIFAGLCFLGAVINLDVAAVSLITDKNLALQVDRLTYFFSVFSVPVLIQFVHVFLGIKRRGWLEYLAYFFSLVFLFFSPSSLFISGLQVYSFGVIAKAGPVFHAFAAVSGLAVCYCCATLFSSMRKAKENERRNRIKYILVGAGLITVLIVLNVLPVQGFPIYPPGNFSFIPATFLAFGVLKYDLLDIGAVIRHGAIYFILTVLLTLFYLIIIYFFNSFLLAPGEGTVLIPFALALFMVLLFNPINERVRTFIDNLFFRGRYDYRQLLKEISGKMASLLKLHQIRELLLQSISSALQVSPVCILLYDLPEKRFILYTEGGGADVAGRPFLDQTHPLVRFLEKTHAPFSRMSVAHLGGHSDQKDEMLRLFDDLGATMIIPMLSGERLLGMIALGDKKSGELLVHEDIEVLTTIANQAVTAVENARSYEEIEKMNHELERKIAQKTASLRNALEEKEKTQNQLVQSESLAAIGQLVAGVAHELNNPLASASSLIQTSAETLSRSEIRNEKQAEVVDDLKFSLKELKRMADIVRSLLDLSRKTQVYKEPVLVNAAIDDALRILYNQYKYLRVEIEKKYASNLPVIEGNYANLGQVFINVTKNAFQSLPNGTGRIVLTTSYNEEKDRVVIECSDTGKGIPPHHLKDIFKPFFTTKGVGEGTGLGLYISHEIIKRHGGSIDVTSGTGRGTSVIIELPCRRREE